MRAYLEVFIRATGTDEGARDNLDMTVPRDSKRRRDLPVRYLLKFTKYKHFRQCAGSILSAFWTIERRTSACSGRPGPYLKPNHPAAVRVLRQSLSARGMCKTH